MSRIYLDAAKVCWGGELASVVTEFNACGSNLPPSLPVASINNLLLIDVTGRLEHLECVIRSTI